MSGCPACERSASGGQGHSAAELARYHGAAEPAEAIAGRAMLGDFQHAAHEFTTGTQPVVDWMAWALRLGQHLQALLDALSRAEPPAANVVSTGGAHLARGDVYLVVSALRDAAEYTDPATAATYRQLASQLDGDR